MTPLEVVKSALEALERFELTEEMRQTTCNALYSAIEQIEKAEPVAWVDWDSDGSGFLTISGCGVPLYAHPAPTDEALHKDAERLDWIENNFHVLGFTHGENDWFMVYVDDNRRFSNMREAIDAAMNP